MRAFVFRFVVFITLWTLLIVENIDQLVISLLILALSMLFFFFLSYERASIFLYIAVSLTLFIHAIIVKEYFYTSLLLLLILTVTTYRLGNKLFYAYLVFNGILFVILNGLYNESLVPTMIVGGALSYFLILVQKNTTDRKRHEHEKETALAQYRELKRIHVSQEEVARAEERTRIAREIHDSVGHQLTALIMKLEMLHIEQPNDAYVQLKEIAKESLSETRKAVETLQTTEASGISAVVQLIRKLEAENELLITFTVKEGVLSIPLSNERGIVLYRVIQEALTNVMRHAYSKQVHIFLGKSPIEALTFKISNPITSTHKFREGFGLKNMRARVEEIEGKIDFYQTENEFIIQGTIPYE